MRVIIAGCRARVNYAQVLEAIRASKFEITAVLSGGADGADRLGEDWASRHGIPVSQYPANWKKYGKAAGPIRNEEMASSADALIALWDCKSRGTKNMIVMAREKGLEIYIQKI